MSGKQEKVSLYFHIPFCTKKCDYCHFFVLPNKEPLHKQLMEGLLLDLNSWKHQLSDKKIVSIYFGGGTPSLLGPERLSILLKAVQEISPYDPCEVEITLEANPETVTPEMMEAYGQAGVNRVSMGVQSLYDPHLIRLGRTHKASTPLKSIESTLKAGIKNISIDLMYDIPGQTIKTWQETLQIAKALPITHLSLYNLTIEPHTVFFKYRESLKKELPDSETSTKMYEMAIEELEEAGLKQYEISAFARDGLISVHNTGYWTARPFLGLGPSAFSYWQGERFRSVANLNRYVEALQQGRSPADFREKLPAKESRRELLTIALRLKTGVDIDSFEAANGKLDQETRGVLDLMVEQGYLWKQRGTIGLTPKGTLFYDTVATELV